MAPQIDLYRGANLAGSGCSTLSSVLFLVKEPYCQTAAWVGVGVDTMNVCLDTGNQMFNWANRCVCSLNFPSDGVQSYFPTEER